MVLRFLAINRENRAIVISENGGRQRKNKRTPVVLTGYRLFHAGEQYGGSFGNRTWKNYTGASVSASCLMSLKTDRYITATKMTNTNVDWAVPAMQQVS